MFIEELALLNLISNMNKNWIFDLNIDITNIIYQNNYIIKWDTNCILLKY